MTYKYKKFVKLPTPLKLLATEAMFTQYCIWMVLLFVPFKRIPGMFPNPKHPVGNFDLNLLEQIRLATAYANMLSFWKNKCLVQSLAARRMLKRRKIPSRLSMGLMLDENKNPVAHAWIKAGEFEIVKNEQEFNELFTF